MESPALISVIIPTRNRLAFLREAIASVQRQSFADWELIVVDDCSQDGTWDWLGSLDDKRIPSLRMDEHRERSVSRNAGLRAAGGEFVMFLDDDDWLLDGALTGLSDALRQQSTAAGAVGALIYENSWGSWNRAPHPRRRVFKKVWEDMLFGWIPHQGRTLLRKSAIVEAGGWKEAMRLSEDYHLWLRLWRYAPAVLIPQPVVAYRIHPGQTPQAGVWALNIKLRRAAVANEGTDERQRAERSILAHRLIRQSWRALERGHPWKALGRCGQAALSAPWLLASPPSRVLIAETAWRSFVHATLGTWVTERLRKAKRALTRRGELRPPRLAAVPSTTALRGGTDSRS